MAGKEVGQERDELAESLNDLFTNVSTMIKGDLQGTNNLLELLEKMNIRVAEVYKGFGDVASGSRVLMEQLKSEMEQLKSKASNFDEHDVQQITAIQQQVAEIEAIISILETRVSVLESEEQSVHGDLNGSVASS